MGLPRWLAGSIMSFFRRVATNVYAPNTCNPRRSISLGIVAVAAVLFGPAVAHSQSTVRTSAVQITTAGRKYLVANPTNQPQPSNNKQEDEPKPKKEKGGSFIIAPIPISSPAFGSGLLVVTAYVFKLNEQDKVSAPSWLGAAGTFTNNGTRGLALGGRLYIKENKYQTTVAEARGQANLDFFGIGRVPGGPAISVPLQMDGTIIFGKGMRSIGKNIFVGPRYQYRRLAANIDGPSPPNGFEIPASDIKSNSAALGLQMQRDLRDNTFYPTKGSLFDFTADFFDQTWGSRREYQTYRIAFNGFHELRKRHVFAYRMMGCSANGSVPFHELCLFGFNNDLRGYTTGAFQNRRMFATQGEYRIDWRKRLGFVGFGGVGGVGRTWGDFRSDQLLPAGGVGMRFNLDKKNLNNYRVDLAFGREDRRPLLE